MQVWCDEAIDITHLNFTQPQLRGVRTVRPLRISKVNFVFARLAEEPGEFSGESKPCFNANTSKKSTVVRLLRKRPSAASGCYYCQLLKSTSKASHLKRVVDVMNAFRQ